MNRVDLIGNLTRDVELQKTKDGVAVAKFTIAVNRTHKNDQGEYDTDFFQITVWRDLADNVAKYVKKGNKVAVCGEIRTGSYESKEGEKKYTTEILANEVEFLTPKNKDEKSEIETETDGK
jgi:single-strand DNA-binding protein